MSDNVKHLLELKKESYQLAAYNYRLLIRDIEEQINGFCSVSNVIFFYQRGNNIWYDVVLDLNDRLFKFNSLINDCECISHSPKAIYSHLKLLEVESKNLSVALYEMSYHLSMRLSLDRNNVG